MDPVYRNQTMRNSKTAESSFHRCVQTLCPQVSYKVYSAQWIQHKAFPNQKANGRKKLCEKEIKKIVPLSYQ